MTEDRTKKVQNPTAAEELKPPPSSDETETLKNQIEKLETELEEEKEKYVRLFAEMNNMRQRNQREVQNARDYGLKEFVQALLPTIDTLEKALSTMQEEKSTHSEGIQMTLQVLEKSLGEHEIQVLNPINEPFNHDIHEAIAQQPSPEHENGNVLIVVQKGYTVNGRLIRPAKVIVCHNT